MIKYAKYLLNGAILFSVAAFASAAPGSAAPAEADWVEEAALYTYYLQILPRFRAMAVGQNEYHVYQILTQTEDGARAALAEINAGATFESVAQRVSIDRVSALKGGDMGWVNGANPPNPPFVTAITDAMHALGGPGVYASPVHSTLGWHVVRVQDFRPAQAPTFEQVRPSLLIYLNK